ncbi:hypothetical protein [Sphingomicrobium arenosum]|uniref:hypothetical protein n=1 Tax=Sphingomicrobium arenosum TaxID=2233861 RepID=UPI00223F3D82|nr:hypothetical protein [Sphingomicrobium arenosum]
MRRDPTAAPRREPYRAAELAAFLRALALTGNVALAAATIHRPKAGLYKLRARNPAFAARCTAALAAFHKYSSPHPGERTAKLAARLAKLGEGRVVEQSDTPEPPPLRYLPARGTRRAQIRRAPPGSLTPAREADFLAALACTGNVRLAADSIAIAASSIHRRRKTDPDFARRFDEAQARARQVVEDLIAERALQTFDPDTRRAAPGAPSPDPTHKLTTSQALQFLQRMDKGR